MKMSAASELTIQLLLKRVKSVFDYLTPFLPLANFPMVNFFIGKAWQMNIPKEIQEEIQTQTDIEEATEIYWQHLHAKNCDYSSEKFKHFRSFLSNTKTFHLDNFNDVWTTPEDLFEIFNNNLVEAPPIKGFMSIKKNHEVEIATDVIASMCESYSNQNREKLCVIDAGDGKGYLSTRLSLEHNIKVLGVDCNPTNTLGALQRSQKLERFWDGMKTKAEESIADNKPKTKINRKKNRKERKEKQNQNDEKRSVTISENYANATCFITSKTDFVKLFSEKFQIDDDKVPGMCLTGLHTCGNLGPSCLRIYTENEQITALCNIGCCYHLLTEKWSDFVYRAVRREKSPTSKSRQVYESPENANELPIHGFPMSNYLNEKKTKLGRNARMSACQSVHRMVDRRERPNNHLFYRALLEVLIQRKFPEYLDRTEVGRMKQCESFLEYVRKSAIRNPWLALDTIADEELNNLYDEFKDQQPLMNLYHLIRVTMAAVVECAILLDRLLYLRENEESIENGVTNTDLSYLVRFFDPVISPRCYGFVAMKKFHEN